MLDETSLKGRVIAGALRLAACKPWADVTMRDIADEAGTDLVGLRGAFPSKTAIVSAFARATDDAVLARVPKFTGGEAARDRIFDVIMTRFDVLAPYKPALKSIAQSRPMEMELARRGMATQAWMLHAAGVPTDGVLGFSRVAGLSAIYLSVLDTWINDDDPGLARTMAALDRHLQRGEQAASALSGLLAGAERLASGLQSVLGSRRTTSASTTATPAQDPTQAQTGV